MSDYKERPILFSAPMVRAILDGSKTQTRRVAKHERAIDSGGRIGWFVPKYPQAFLTDDQFVRHCCPYGQPGDLLWVREAWANGATRTMYRADCSPQYTPPDGRWRPSIHMPRWASRITLEITGVRVERLQDISEADAIAEGINLEGEGIFFAGIYGTASHTAKDSYRLLWESLNGEKSWDVNPWVWVVEFKVAKAGAA